MPRVHVIGAGLAGLAAAVRLAERGIAVSLYDQSPQAGGRARSYEDKHLGIEIDNGNHLMMTGNWAAMSLLQTIGAANSLIGPGAAVFPFLDLKGGRRWDIRFNNGRLPTWIFKANHRVPNSRVLDYASLGMLALAGVGDTVGDYVTPRHRLYRPLVEPLCVAALNVAPEIGAARLLAAVLKETIMKGAAFSRPRIARTGLSDCFARPALRYLEERGAEINLGRRVADLEVEAGTVAGLRVAGERVSLGDDDMVVLAVPHDSARELLPALETPRGASAIVNVHYRLAQAPSVGWPAPFIGLVGGTAQWLFLRGHVASVTISAAEALVDTDADTIAARVWHDVARALEMPEAALPPARVVKEKRATFLQTPENEARRPATETALANLMLAGDWTATALPATIEGSVRSGYKAADSCFAALNYLGRP